MACVHLFEHREEISEPIRGHALLDLGDHGVAVGLHVRGEPHEGAEEQSQGAEGRPLTAYQLERVTKPYPAK